MAYEKANAYYDYYANPQNEQYTQTYDPGWLDNQSISSESYNSIPYKPYNPYPPQYYPPHYDQTQQPPIPQPKPTWYEQEPIYQYPAPPNPQNFLENFLVTQNKQNEVVNQTLCQLTTMLDTLTTRTEMLTM